MPFDDKPLERQNLHVPVVLDAFDEYHTLNRPHFMDEEISNHHQTRHIYVHAKSTEYGLHAAEKRDSFAPVCQDLSARGPHNNVSHHVFERMPRPHHL